MKQMTRTNNVEIGKIKFGDTKLVFIAGPCVIESRDHALFMAEKLKEISTRLDLPFVFKASFDKANRSSISSFRGVGIEKGLDILGQIKNVFELPVISDIHDTAQADIAAKTLDIIQVPAFLSRQTDLLLAAAKTGKVVNVKKGQFLAPDDMLNVVKKLHEGGCKQVLLTERGASFGYNRLVSDMRSIPIMQSFGTPVVFDATHSVQEPGGLSTTSGGRREFVDVLAKAAVAAGADAIFTEVHNDPDKALCDGPNSLDIPSFEKLAISLMRIREAIL